MCIVMGNVLYLCMYIDMGMYTYVHVCVWVCVYVSLWVMYMYHMGMYVYV